MKEDRAFSVFDWEEEEKYLREMHKKGLKFVKHSGLITYEFEECKPEDVVYQLDYPNEKSDDYIKMFEDCGWEYLGEVYGYTYFRKPVSKMNGHDEEIFSDDESKIKMLKNVVTYRFLPFLLVFVCVVVPGLLRTLHSGIFFLKMLYIITFVIYIGSFIYFIPKIYRLYKK